ncbi:transferase [uncultured Mediterranean phage uvMED]|nr:transferase [uncultured Mediterranean phage uvMED]
MNWKGKVKILNLYACLGGNRYKWDEVADIEVTAVEWDEELAKLYQERFPKDKVIVADAHKYLLDHYKEFDFIWSSPPCPTHSKARGWNTKVETKYPDMKLYEEIILLETVSKGTDARFKGKYVVENVIPYYDPLIHAQKRGRHLYWANFTLPNVLGERKVKVGQGINEVKNLCDFHDYNFYKYKGKQPVAKIARNLVDYEAGRTILETALNVTRKQKQEQQSLF